VTELPPIIVESRACGIHEVQLGSFRIPAGAVEFLFQDALCPPTRMELAQTSRRLGSIMGDTWAQSVRKLWPALWKHTQGGVPDGDCGCIFQPPVTTSHRGNIVNALKLWRAQTLLCVNIRVKDLPVSSRFFALGEETEPHVSHMPVLLRTSVMDLKILAQNVMGFPLHPVRLAHPSGRQLLHERAPLGAYVWDLLAPRDVLSSSVKQAESRLGRRSGTMETLKLELLLRMSTRTCADHLRPSAVF